MRDTASSGSVPTTFQGRTSLMEPVGPPSELAPLSDSTRTTVSSRSPSSSRWASRRPIWWSVWDR